MFVGAICCLGGNRAGGILSCVIASKCPGIRVDVIDTDEVTAKWNNNLNPLNEPGLDKMLMKCRNRNLFFSSKHTPLKQADLVFVSPDLSHKRKGFGKEVLIDIKPLEDAAMFIAAHGETDKIVVEKSAMPRAAESMSLLLNANARSGVNYHVLSNPDFFGESLDNLLNNIIVIGCPNSPNGRQAAEGLCWVYEHWIPRKNIIVLNTWWATVTKLVVSSFLAQEQTSINTFAEICEKTGADVSEILRLVPSYDRTLSKPPSPSLELAGTKTELLALVLLCQNFKQPGIADFWQRIIDYNDYCVERFTENVSDIMSPLASKNISLWGIKCKTTPQLIRNSSALEICKFLLSQGAKVKIYEPIADKHDILSALSDWKGVAAKTIIITKDPYEASTDTQAIIVCNDWNNLNELNFLKICDKMKKPSILFDPTRCLESAIITNSRLTYHTIGTG